LKKTSTAFAIFLLLVGIHSVTAQQNDVKGWREARWGMTEEQILSAFKGEAVRLNEPENYDSWYASVGIPKYDISGEAYFVHFLMGKKSKTLQQVNIIAAEATKEFIDNAFTRLEQILTEKYGTPSFRDEKDERKQVIWNYPSTVITLSYMNMKSIDFKNLVITYHPPSKDKDKI
jgi:hypothetical protein